VKNDKEIAVMIQTAIPETRNAITRELFGTPSKEENIVGLACAWPYVPDITSNLRIDFGIVGFCGLIYPYIRIKTWDTNPYLTSYKLPNVKERNYYDFEEAKNVLEGMEVKISATHGHFRFISLQDIENFFKRAKVNEQLKQLFREKQVAYFHVDHDIETSRIQYYCVLKKHEFYRVFSVTEAYQQVEMFITNVLAPRDNPYEEPISDKLHAQKKGFDEWSFRKVGRKGVGA
jgi:hypothetical protein